MSPALARADACPTIGRMPAIAGVLFDLGGVVMASPLAAIARYERDHGLPDQAITRAIRTSGDDGAWARLERGELSLEAFLVPFEADCRTCGIEVSGAGGMRYITGASAPRPARLSVPAWMTVLPVWCAALLWVPPSITIRLGSAASIRAGRTV